MKIAFVTVITVFSFLLTSGVNAAPTESFEVRLVVECTRGMPIFELEPEDATKAVERLCVSPDVIMTHQDVIKVAKVQKEYNVVIEITYSPSAQARMSQMTKEFVGHRMAILAHGKALIAPVILTPILGDSIDVAGRVDDLDRLLRDLTNGARPL